MTNLGIILIYVTLFVLYSICIECLYQILLPKKSTVLIKLIVLIISCIIGPILFGFLIGKLIGITIQKYI